ncbi:MAG: phosphatase PAP2 family protein [Candidatus Cloacimonetes bacterium]|nr:phosphatase PAP2 family protein [Candidatus Cloacimonadota bacterium]
MVNILRDMYPVLLFGFFYSSASAVNRVIFPNYLDDFFQRIDFAIFGYQPAEVWGQLYDSFLVQELFHFAYFSYYPMIFGVSLAFYIKDRQYFHKQIFMITFLFYSCYLIYMVLPVVGGRALPGLTELTKIYRYGPFTKIMAFIYNRSTHWGGAFPSSHVAVAMLISFTSFRLSKRLGYILVSISLLLSLSIVYCHYHYFIDAVFGILFSIIFFYLGAKVYEQKPVQPSPNLHKESL